LAKAIHIHKDESTVTAITHIDERLGSLYFMPLESLLDSRRPDDRSDIFALGVTVFVTLTGEYPFKRARNILHFYEERASGRRSLSQVTAVSWPAALERFLDRALEEDREKRFQNATDALLAWRAVPWTTEV
jgi:serine/threonine protein kinase